MSNLEQVVTAPVQQTIDQLKAELAGIESRRKQLKADVKRYTKMLRLLSNEPPKPRKQREQKPVAVAR